MLDASRADNSPFALYEPGDILRICRPGESVSLWEKAGSLLLFPASSLDFSGVAASLVTRILKHFIVNNRVYIGDIVTASADEIAGRRDKGTIKLGDASKDTLRESLERAGLCHELRVAQWPPEDLERLHARLHTQLRVPKYSMSVKAYVGGLYRPSGM